MGSCQFASGADRKCYQKVDLDAISSVGSFAGCHLKRGLVCILSLKLQTAAFSDPERSVQEVCRVSSACAVAKELDATLCCIWKACGTKKHTTDLAMGAGWEALRVTAGPVWPC